MMKKSEIFDLVVKAAGVGFVMLMIYTIPKVLSGLVMCCFLIQGAWSHGESEAAKVMHGLWTTALGDSLNSLLLFIIYFIAALNFLRSGSWVKKLMGRYRITDAPVEKE